ncbi:unnamed protein product [Adineta ricciae]|uniref:Carbohydrate kinase PfkB domain-containing protein n=1 Tax=Adineta ricciae TaxID=249248 RepID=A0A814DF25_ADIRI|nr:unnamed protein product [Adineta ricciae]
MTKIGHDTNGERILQDFRNESNIDTSTIVIDLSMTSPMTYTIVDRASVTRTCLFSAQNEQILASDIQPDCLDQINFIHFDSRSTETAVSLAKLAKSKSIQCSLDLERERPHLDQLIPLMDYIITTENYSLRVCHDSSPIQTAKRLLQTCKFVIITRGKNGSILVERSNTSTSRLIENNPDFGSFVTQEIHQLDGEDYLVWQCTAWPVKQEEIMDTTGCGDAFIGGILYGLLKKESWSRDQLLRFASYIAMCKIKGIGARSTLPYLSAINMNLFE